MATNDLRAGRKGRRRRGFSLLEAEVAFVLLGIGLAGAGPIVIMQLRLTKRIESGITQVANTDRHEPVAPGETRYILRTKDSDDASATLWARRLGVNASLLADSGYDSQDPAIGTPMTAVQLASPVTTASDGTVSFVVEVSP